MRDASLCDSAAGRKSAPDSARGCASACGCAPESPKASTADSTLASSHAPAASRTLASSQPRIRLASADDADGIRTVYAPFVDTPVTFEEEVPSCETYRERIAFQWNAELSIYLAPAAQGQGTGSRLYAALIELLCLMGIKAVYGVVTSPNAASERLHSAFEFALMGVQPHAGFTCGAWHDVSWYVREIAPFEDAPAPPVPFPLFASAHPDQVSEVIAQANERLQL